MAAAQIAAHRSSSVDMQRMAHVLVVSRCFPITNLFRCKDEVMCDGDVW